MKKEEETEKKTEERFVLDEVPTQVEPVIRDTENNEVYNLLTALCKIMNDISIIKKSIA